MADVDEVLTALRTRIEMIFTDITECISTGFNSDLIDHVRNCSDGLYRCLAGLAAKNPSYDDILHLSRGLVDIIHRPIFNDENVAPEPSQGATRPKPERPKFDISRNQLQYLFEHNFTTVQIAQMLQISLSTVRRRMRELQAL